MQTQLYGVPQKRKRVILICVRNDIDASPSQLYPSPITTEADAQITARMAIADLENIECGETAKYDGSEYSDYAATMRGEMTFEELLREIARNRTPIVNEPMQITLY